MVIVPVILLLAILVVSWTPLSRNLGLPFGYYRDYSRILYEIGKIDRVAVTKVRLHEDVTLEDFSVTVDIDGRTVHLDFQPESETMKQMLKKLDQIR